MVVQGEGALMTEADQDRVAGALREGLEGLTQ